MWTLHIDTVRLIIGGWLLCVGIVLAAIMNSRPSNPDEDEE